MYMYAHYLYIHVHVHVHVHVDTKPSMLLIKIAKNVSTFSHGHVYGDVVHVPQCRQPISALRAS